MLGENVRYLRLFLTHLQPKNKIQNHYCVNDYSCFTQLFGNLQGTPQLDPICYKKSILSCLEWSKISDKNFVHKR